MPDDMSQLLRAWGRLGILFDVEPAEETPDLEELLIRTARLLPAQARLLPTVVTWLATHERIVARHRLASLIIGQVPERQTLAALGLLLDLARERTHTDHLSIAIRRCRPLKPGQPLFNVDRALPGLAAEARNAASRTSRKWGLWTAPPEWKDEAIRPAAWVLRHNPSLLPRTVFSGSLRASVLVLLTSEPHAGRSESSLAAALHVTRKALREALDHLAYCGLVKRRRTGGASSAIECEVLANLTQQMVGLASAK